jgi:VanZ family protein
MERCGAWDDLPERMVRSRLLVTGCVVYLLFLLYASLMPYDFTASPQQVSEHFRYSLDYWPFGGQENTSLSDVLSNILLYVPAGLMISTTVAVRRRGGSWRGLLLAAGICLAVSATVETLQAFSLTRVCSAQDVLMNTLGGSAGGLLGAFRGRRGWIILRRRARLAWRDDPGRFLGLGAMALLAADAACPFRPTLDVSQVAHNVRDSLHGLGQGLSLHAWHYWLVMRIAVYAALTMLLAKPGRSGAALRGWRAALAMALFATAIEMAKVFIEGRSANIANITMSSCGAAIGAILVAALGGTLSARVRLALAVALTSGLLVYIELEPFLFSWDVPAMAKKIPSGAEWLPLYYYAMHAGAEDVWMFARAVILSGGAIAAAGRLWTGLGGLSRVRFAATGAAMAAALGLILELAQFTLPGRMPTVTDVFSFAFGGALGGWLSRSRKNYCHPMRYKVY